MEFRGVYENGVIRPTGAVNLPEGTPVEFHPVAAGNGAPPPPPGAIGTLSEVQIREMQERFWKGKSLQELAAEQGVKPVESMDDLRGPGVTDEDMEALEQIIRERRSR